MEKDFPPPSTFAAFYVFVLYLYVFIVSVCWIFGFFNMNFSSELAEL